MLKKKKQKINSLQTFMIVIDNFKHRFNYVIIRD